MGAPSWRAANRAGALSSRGAGPMGALAVSSPGLAARLALAAALAAACSEEPPGAAISIACGAVGIEFELCRSGAEAWGRRAGHPVRVISTPKESNEVLAQYLQLLAARAPDVDVLRVDVVWPGILARHLVDLRAWVPADVTAAHLPAAIEASTVDGRLVALPWFADVGLLYYRSDLLERYGRPAPRTWQELTETARLVQEGERRAGNPRMWGLVFQGRAYEGLTCNALEWVESFGGGSVVDAQGEITVDNPRAAEALRLAASWVGTIAPRGVLNYGEEEARAAFQSGNAVFMRSWPYAWALAQAADSPVRGRVKVAPLPAGGPGGRHAGALGGWQLAVSRYSRNPAAAVDLALHLTSAGEQRRAALEASLNPTRPALYDDPELLRANPFMGELRGLLAGAVPRPSRVTGARYNQVSSELRNAVHDVLAGRTAPEEALSALAASLRRISREGRWR